MPRPRLSVGGRAKHCRERAEKSPVGPRNLPSCMAGRDHRRHRRRCRASTSAEPAGPSCSCTQMDIHPPATDPCSRALRVHATLWHWCNDHCGQTRNPQDLQSWQGFSDDFLRFLTEEQDAPVVAVGHSMGATVALTTAFQVPDTVCRAHSGGTRTLPKAGAPAHEDATNDPGRLPHSGIDPRRPQPSENLR